VSFELRVGQVLRCNKEHFGLGPTGVFAMSEGDLIVVVETTSYCQGRGVRLDDGIEISLLTLDQYIFDNGGAFVGTEPPTYSEVS